MARADSSASETAAPMPLKKPDLLDQLATRSGLKKRDAKLALDATLALIGEALARGDDLLLPPLGRVRVVKAKDLGAGAQLLTLKLRSGKDASQSGKTGLATAVEDV
ncbi:MULTISPECIES: HU family DNA-binding protein [Yoonia]|nr:HU family DNA-binding protein [Yoonia vestfoldensis]